MTFEEQLEKLSNWGKWGADDERGALNYITDAKRAEAAKLVRCEARAYGQELRARIAHSKLCGAPAGRRGPHQPTSLHDRHRL
jgi:hypothetical protein